MLKEFVAFLKQYGVIGLAIAVVIGGKVKDLVKPGGQPDHAAGGDPRARR